MTTKPKVILAGLGVLATAMIVALSIGVRHQRNERTAIVAHLTRAASAGDTTQIEPPELAKLPAPVARYLQRALSRNLELQLVRLTQLGTLRTDVRSQR